VNDQILSPAALLSEKAPSNHQTGAWVGPIAEKWQFLNLPDLNSYLSLVQPVASGNTDCATTALRNQLVTEKKQPRSGEQLHLIFFD
jgi:hypothetical protein